MKKFVVFDLDGTLADCRHRLNLLPAAPGLELAWEDFFHAASNDGLVDWVRDLLNTFRNHYGICICTARPIEYKKMTLDWLQKHKIQFDSLLMRPSKDRREDWVVKLELFKFVETQLDWEIKYVFEDREGCVENFRLNGYNVLQVANVKEKNYVSYAVTK